MLIVIDEAHNVCPSDPPDALTALATEYAVRIAAEGRKFGVYLLVCTQRPQKVQENVISQCDNLVLMRMASEADLGYTGDLLGFAPRACWTARRRSGSARRWWPGSSPLTPR